jgi:hypothetical protein
MNPEPAWQTPKNVNSKPCQAVFGSWMVSFLLQEQSDGFFLLFLFVRLLFPKKIIKLIKVKRKWESDEGKTHVIEKQPAASPNVDNQPIRRTKR